MAGMRVQQRSHQKTQRLGMKGTTRRWMRRILKRVLQISAKLASTQPSDVRVDARPCVFLEVACAVGCCPWMN